MKRLVLGLIVIGLAAPVFVEASGSGAPTFAQTTVDLTAAGEPGIIVDPADPSRFYATFPQEGSTLWRSNDSGATWMKLRSTNQGGGDADVAIDAAGTAYVTDLLSNAGTLKSTVPVSVMFNASRSRAATPYAYTKHMDPTAPQGAITWDREWVAAEGQGHVIVTARSGSRIAAWVSTDSLRTYTAAITVASDATRGGQVFFAPDGTAYMPYCAAASVRVAKSTDGGLTWTRKTVASLTGACAMFPSLDADTDGNLYYAWADMTGTLIGLGPALRSQVYVSVSTDGGGNWTAKRQLSDPNKNSVFPWVAAGVPGKVNVAFYTENFQYYPELGTPIATWDVVMSQSLDALSPTPTYVPTIARAAFHTGSVCMSGIACIGPQNVGIGNVPTPYDRRVLDYFEMDTNATGDALIIYPLDRPATDPLNLVDVIVARQSGGTNVG